MKIGIIYGEEIEKYDFGPGHPFRGNRFKNFLSLFMEKFSASGKFDFILNNFPANSRDLLLWHNNEYVKAISEASEGYPREDIMQFVSIDNLNPRTNKIPLGIEKAARIIVKNSLIACKTVQEGKFEKSISLGGGLHHAKSGYGEGFCIYNDVVISAKLLIKQYGLKRILILDTDAHSGNGTCEAFFSDKKVLFIDLHQENIYPGTGFENDIGKNKGKGFTVNIPLPAYSGDDVYKLVFEEVVLPLAEEFDPQFVIRNGGSDPHFSDPLTHLGLSLEGFKYIGEKTRQIAQICQDKEVDLICSGYDPRILPQAWLSLISGLAGVEFFISESVPQIVREETNLKKVKEVINNVKDNIYPYWHSMK